MKVAIILVLVAACNASFLDSVLDGVKDVAGHVADGVKDAAGTVGDGVKDVAGTVGDGVKDVAGHVVDGVKDAAHALGPVGHALENTFGDVWEVAKDPLEQAGKELLIKAGEFALEQGVMLALNALAAGKRELPTTDALKMYLKSELIDEYNKWRQDIEQQILGSKDELLQQIASVSNINDLPSDIKDYVDLYRQAVLKGNVKNFIDTQAGKAFEKATDALKDRLRDRLTAAIQNLQN